MKQKFNLLIAVLCLSLIGVNKLEEKNFESKILFETGSDPIRMTEQKNYRQILNDMEEIGNVTVELSYDSFTLEDFVSKYGFYDKEMFRAELREYHTRKNNELMERLNIQEYVLDMSNYSPYLCLDAELFTKDDLYLECYELASNANVEEIFITEQRVIKTTELSMEESDIQPIALASSTARVAYDNYPENCNFTGEGIKIGILESSGLDLNDPRMSGIDAEIVIDTVTSNDGDHGMCVSLVMCSPIDGIAPGASIYYADVDSRTNLLCLENLIDVGCDVVNMSFGLLTLTDSVAYDASIEGYLDYLYNTTRLIMVAAAGNGLCYVSREGKVPLPASAANVIAVGSVSRDNYVSDFSSCFVLKKIYSKPEISAVGSHRFITNYGSVTGTSFSAPAVTATIALLLQGISVPMNTQQILALLAGTSNINANCNGSIQRLRSQTNSTIVDTIEVPNTYDVTNGLYTRLGAGRLDISRAINEALNYFSNNPFATPMLSAYQTETLGTVYVPAGSLFRVAVAIERKTTTYWLLGTQYRSLDMPQFFFTILDEDNVPVLQTYTNDDYFTGLRLCMYEVTESGYYRVLISCTDCEGEYETRTFYTYS